MKHETTNLLLGLGIGAVVGVAVGYLMVADNRKKLAEELQAKSGIEVDRKNVSLNAPINKVGEYKMLIKLTSKVKAELAVIVTASEVLKEAVEEVAETEAE